MRFRIIIPTLVVTLIGSPFSIQASCLQSNMQDKEERERVATYQSATALKPVTGLQFNDKNKLSPIVKKDQFPYSNPQPIKFSSPEAKRKALEFLTNIPIQKKEPQT